MLPLVQELKATLDTLDPQTARMVEQLVRDALLLACKKAGVATPPKNGWPEHYFDRTAGAMAGELFEKPGQGAMEERAG